MARAPSKFRQGDVTRAVKGALAAGVEVREVLVDTDGKIRVIAGKAPANSAYGPNPWDAELAAAQILVVDNQPRINIS
jgi:hypothetical protein